MIKLLKKIFNKNQYEFDKFLELKQDSLDRFIGYYNYRHEELKSDVKEKVEEVLIDRVLTELKKRDETSIKVKDAVYGQVCVGTAPYGQWDKNTYGPDIEIYEEQEIESAVYETRSGCLSEDVKNELLFKLPKHLREKVAALWNVKRSNSAKNFRYNDF
ncbi:hypothetical protein GMMP13_100031 [Candidatus Magnetomoraceae bacterium gMMP-13]